MSEYVVLQVGGFRDTLEVIETTHRLTIVAPTNNVPDLLGDMRDPSLGSVSKRWEFEYDRDAAGIKMYKFVREA